MKRHLLGFALFNLIVGLTLFVWVLMPKNSDISEVKPFEYEVSKYSCWKNVRQNSSSRKSYSNANDSIKITQAVLNEKTNKLNLSFAIQRETPTTQDMKVRLTFIDGSYTAAGGKFDGTVNLETVTLSPDFDVYNKAVYSLPVSYKWLKNSSEKENFYVKAEIDNGNYESVINSARSSKDMKSFTPILLMNDK